MQVAVGRVKGQYWSIADPLETRVGWKPTKTHDVKGWARQWSASLINRFQVRLGVKTAYQRTQRKTSDKPLAELGKRVMHLPLNGAVERKN